MITDAVDANVQYHLANCMSELGSIVSCMNRPESSPRKDGHEHDVLYYFHHATKLYRAVTRKGQERAPILRNAALTLYRYFAFLWHRVPHKTSNARVLHRAKCTRLICDAHGFALKALEVSSSGITVPTANNNKATSSKKKEKGEEEEKGCKVYHEIADFLYMKSLMCESFSWIQDGRLDKARGQQRWGRSLMTPLRSSIRTLSPHLTVFGHRVASTIFHAADQDENGFLGRQDLLSLLRYHWLHPEDGEKYINKLMSRCDVNECGEVTLTGFGILLYDLFLHTPMCLLRALQEYGIRFRRNHCGGGGGLVAGESRGSWRGRSGTETIIKSPSPCNDPPPCRTPPYHTYNHGDDTLFPQALLPFHPLPLRGDSLIILWCLEGVRLPGTSQEVRARLT